VQSPGSYTMENEMPVTSSVLITVPVHNALAHALDCLKSFEQEGQSMADILIVDNGSTNETAATIKRLFPQVKIVRQANLGYSAAANVGIIESLKRNYKYTWLLNSDTVVLRKTLWTLETFMDLPENRRVGACSPVIYRGDDASIVDFAGGWLNRANWSVRHINDPACGDKALRAKPHETFLTGSALFIRNKAATEAGMFDERFFMYWEDCDFSIRLVNHGWGLRLVPSAVVLHRMQGSSGGNGGRTPFSIYYETRNCFLLWRQYSKGLISRLITLPRILHWIVRTFINRRFSLLNEAKCAAVEGVVDGLAGRYGQKARSLTKRQIQVIALLLWYAVLPVRLISQLSTVK
jgi:GT2 family glycosyltransferase